MTLLNIKKNRYEFTFNNIEDGHGLVAERLKDSIFDKYDVIKMRGDLTKPNKEINEYINILGRFGIPVNIIYSPSTPQGVLLSEVLTVKSLLSTFERVKND